MHVTFATDDVYAPLTAVAMYSVCAAVPATTSLHITVLGDRLDRTSRTNLTRALESRPDVPLDFIDVADLLEPLDLIPIDRRLIRTHTRAVWTSLLLGSVLPGGLRRTLYLDSDVIVRSDPSALWHLDLDGNVIGAVLSEFRHTLGMSAASATTGSSGSHRTSAISTRACSWSISTGGAGRTSRSGAARSSGTFITVFSNTTRRCSMPPWPAGGCHWPGSGTP